MTEITAASRPPKKSERTQAAILAAARALFAEAGFPGTTVRAIAARAGVDPALVIRYFGSKEALFVRVSDFSVGTIDLSGVPPGRIGEALVRHFLTLWEGEGTAGSLPILLRTAAVSETAAERMREVFALQVRPVIEQLAPDNATARAGLIATQMLGLAFCRYVVALPPVTALDAGTIVATVGRTVEAYLTGPLR
jgi:AcrR family transcriptional regulator